MVLIKEYRIVMPLTVDEYRIGQLYTVAQLSKNETGGGDGVEVLQNEPFTGKPLFNGEYSTGQYTKKIYIGKKKVNGIVRTLLPESALKIVEEAWNAYPYCRTQLKNEYMGDDFDIKVESLHLPGRGEQENAHKLSPELLAQREVVMIDIAADIADGDYKAAEDPALFKSEVTGRGPLQPGWMSTWFGLQSIVENKIQKAQRRLFTIFHRQVFCQLDEWHGMSIEDIRIIERQTQRDLLSVIKKGSVKGMKQNE